MYNVNVYTERHSIKGDMGTFANHNGETITGMVIMMRQAVEMANKNKGRRQTQIDIRYRKRYRHNSKWSAP